MLVTVTAVLSGSTVWGMGPQYGHNNNSSPSVTMTNTIKAIKLTDKIVKLGQDLEASGRELTDDQVKTVLAGKLYDELQTKAKAVRDDIETNGGWDNITCARVGNCLAPLPFSVNIDSDFKMHSYAQFCDKWAESMHTLSTHPVDSLGNGICKKISAAVGLKCYPFKDVIKFTSYDNNYKLLKVIRCKK